jgi:hypothetical protein
MFNLMELLYFNQGTENTGWLDDSIVDAAAASIPGVDVARFRSARDSSSARDRARTYASQATADGVQKTPTFLVGKTGGALHEVLLTSPADPAPLLAAIKKASS